MDRGEQAIEALVVLDVITTFEHDDGDQLLQSMRRRAPVIRRVLEGARTEGIDVIYVNDAAGSWDGDAPGHVRRALAAEGGEIIKTIAPVQGDSFLFKAAYSAFHDTPLRRVLGERGVTRIVLVGAATEMCVAQTAIDAREQDLQVTVVRDACASVDPFDERIALDYLEHVTGSVIHTADRWLHGAHASFAALPDGQPAQHEQGR